MSPANATLIRLRENTRASLGNPAATPGLLRLRPARTRATHATRKRHGEIHTEPEQPRQTDAQRQQYGHDQHELDREPLLREPELEPVPPAGNSVEHTTRVLQVGWR